MAFIEKVSEKLEAFRLPEIFPKMPPTPFVFNREIDVVWPNNLNPLNIQRLLDDAKNGHLTKRDLTLAETLFRHRYLSARQLQRLFFTELKNKSFFAEKMDKLAGLRIVNSLGWKVNGKMAKTRAYHLDSGGAALLQYYLCRDMGDWQVNHNYRALSYIYGILMANEIYVQLVEITKKLGEDEGLGIFEIEPRLKISDKVKDSVTPTARFNFNRRGKQAEFMIEVLRGAEAEIAYLPGKLRKYNDWYITKNLTIPPVLIIVTEKESQGVQVEKMMTALGLNELKKWSRYSTDVRLGSETLDKVFCEIKGGEIKRSSAPIFAV